MSEQQGDTHVLVVSIGPVQEFISTARRCRDFWYGSWLLSALGRAVARGVLRECIAAGGSVRSVVFPGIESDSDLAHEAATGVANRIVALVPGGRDAARRAAGAGRDEMQKTLEAAMRLAFERAGKGDPRRDQHFDVERATEQVGSMMEYHWVASEIGSRSYAEARAEADRRLAARKNTSVWGQPGWADTVPKSSLDGIRESVLHESLFDRPKDPDVRGGDVTPDARRRWYGVHGAERLCGVGLLKRMGQGPDGDTRFFSTSHLAALPWIDAFSRTEGASEAWTKFRDTIRGISDDLVQDLRSLPGPANPVTGRCDGGILFEGRLAEELAEVGADDRVDDAAEALRRLLRSSGTEPFPYYAILIADGDGMGQAIRRIDDAGAHRDFSLRLSAFAAAAARIVAEHQGSAVYAGGDDLLAMIPLHRLLDALEGIRRAFREHVEAWWTDRVGPDGSPTLSAGVALVHHLEPLEHALGTARRAESVAKSRPGKNSVCFVADKRGGAPVDLVVGWGAIEPGGDLRRAVGWHLEGAIPRRLGYELQSVATVLRGVEGMPALEPAERDRIAALEAARIVGRKRTSGGGEELDDSISAELLGSGGTGGAEDLDRIAARLYVAEMLSRGARFEGAEEATT